MMRSTIIFRRCIIVKFLQTVVQTSSWPKKRVKIISNNGNDHSQWNFFLFGQIEKRIADWINFFSRVVFFLKFYWHQINIFPQIDVFNVLHCSRRKENELNEAHTIPVREVFVFAQFSYRFFNHSVQTLKRKTMFFLRWVVFLLINFDDEQKKNKFAHTRCATFQMLASLNTLH